VQRAHAVVPELLVRLEQARATEVRWLGNPRIQATDEAVIREVEDRLTEVGVDHASSVQTADPGVSFIATKPGAAISGQDFVDAIETEAWKRDNRSKLEEMATDERHLFVWVDYSKPEAHAILRLSVLPLPVPNLPPELTTLWVSARTSDEDGDWQPSATRRLAPPGSWMTI
jgi:hypothetical protein